MQAVFGLQSEVLLYVVDDHCAGWVEPADLGQIFQINSHYDLAMGAVEAAGNEFLLRVNDVKCPVSELLLASCEDYHFPSATHVFQKVFDKGPLDEIVVRNAIVNQCLVQIQDKHAFWPGHLPRRLLELSGVAGLNKIARLNEFELVLVFCFRIALQSVSHCVGAESFCQLLALHLPIRVVRSSRAL